MNEKGKNKREWIKTAAIIFLAVMLVLTFFSNTIMNYSLPEVATQYVQSGGSITARIRGTGVVESGDPYEMIIKESRKVSSVAVRVGQEVQKGDVILYLEDSESEELKLARQTLEDAQDALQSAQDNYYLALLSSDISVEDIQVANSDVSASTYRQRLSVLQSEIKTAQNAVKPLEDKVAEIEQNISAISSQLSLESSLDASANERVTATQSAMETAQARLEAAVSNLNNAKNALDQAKADSTVSAGDAAEEQVKQAQTAYDNAQTEQTNAQNNYNNAVAAYNNAISTQAGREGSQTKANLTSQQAYYQMELYNAKNELEAAQASLSEKEQALVDLLAQVGDVFGAGGLKDQKSAIEDAQKAVDEAQKTVDELVSKAVNATVTADISGTITAINVVAGNTAAAGSAVAVIQPEGQGYTLSFSVTNDQARRVAVGDRADLVNSWRYDDVDVVLASIRPDTSDPSQRKLLTFNISGGVVAGQTLSLSVGQQSANFDLVVPNSAIREDANGQFILIVESRSTPLGNRYIASRVDVQVLASDDTQSAISAALYGYEFVITTSTQPVEAGQQVRLADN